MFENFKENYLVPQGNENLGSDAGVKEAQREEPYSRILSQEEGGRVLKAESMSYEKGEGGERQIIKREGLLWGDLTPLEVIICLPDGAVFAPKEKELLDGWGGNTKPGNVYQIETKKDTCFCLGTT